MKPSEAMKWLADCLKHREPYGLFGAPGSGKTSLVEDACKEADVEYIPFHPVTMEPIDVRGMPSVGVINGEMQASFTPFGDFKRIVVPGDPRNGFFDDIGQALPAMQNALTHAFLAREINGTKIPDNVTLGFASNRRQDKAGVTGITTTLLSRATLIEVEFDLDDWVRWGVSNNLPPELLAFARMRPELISSFEPKADLQNSPTPRNAARAGRWIEHGYGDNYEVMAGCSGPVFGTEFTAFYSVFQSLPRVEDILLNPSKVKVPEKPDVLYALMGSLAHHAKPQNWDVMLEYINRVPRQFQVLVVKDAALRQPALTSTNAFRKWAENNKEVFGYAA